MKILPILLALLFILIRCQSIDNEAEKEILLQTDKEFAKFSVENGAATAFNQYLTEDALELPAGRNPIEGRENIVKLMNEGKDTYTLDWSPQVAEVSKSGELGYTWGFYTLTYNDENGKEQRNYGKYLNIWKKQLNGDWKVAVDMGNQSPNP